MLKISPERYDNERKCPQFIDVWNSYVWNTIRDSFLY